MNSSLQNCCLLLDNSHCPSLERIGNLDEIIERCVIILRFFPDYLDKWDVERKQKFVSFIIEDEFDQRIKDFDIVKINEIFFDVKVKRWNLLSECNHCGNFVYDPVRLFGQLVDRNCLNFLDKKFAVTDVCYLNKLNQQEYTISIAVHKIAERTLFFSYSTTFGQKIGYVIQSLIQRYPEFENRIIYTETGQRLTKDCQDVIGRVSALFLLERDFHTETKIILKHPYIPSLERSVYWQPWWMIYHLMDQFHSDLDHFSSLQACVQFSDGDIMTHKLNCPSSKFLQSCASITKYYLIRSYRKSDFSRKMNHTHIDFLNHFLYQSDYFKITQEVDAYTISNDGIAKIMSEKSNVIIPWQQSEIKSIKLLDALEFILNHPLKYNIIVLILFNQHQIDNSFTQIKDIILSNQRLLVFLPNTQKISKNLLCLRRKFSSNIKICDLNDFYTEIKSLFAFV
jgi:hypothetical protein